MSWLSFAARKWFSAAVTIARRCDGRAWNVRPTKFLSPISTLQPKLNPATCPSHRGLLHKISDIPCRDDEYVLHHVAMVFAFLGEQLDAALALADQSLGLNP